jgi:hypothetical protein
VVNLAGAKHATAVSYTADLHYLVTFDRPVDQCAAQITPVNGSQNAALGYFGLPANQLEVTLWQGDLASDIWFGDFDITVNC